MKSFYELKTAKDVASLMTAMRAALKTRRQKFVLLQGPTGAGKVMLARRLHALLPKPSQQDVEALLWLHHRLRATAEHFADHGPFRAPHHTISHAGMLGSAQGDKLYPGEVSLAHAGTLLLDDVQEFRQSLIDETIHASKTGRIMYRASADESFAVPSKPALVIYTTNSCSCGQLPNERCSCTDTQVLRYTERVETMLKRGQPDVVVLVEMTDDAKRRLETYKR